MAMTSAVSLALLRRGALGRRIRLAPTLLLSPRDAVRCRVAGSSPPSPSLSPSPRWLSSVAPPRASSDDDSSKRKSNSDSDSVNAKRMANSQDSEKITAELIRKKLAADVERARELVRSVCSRETAVIAV
ncbi:hypothetical protein PINS_up006867 [Pythium insidiosum]|nr:hypothetical protein PINS_up006867 [Pythium insidiosum]